jgi:hypothetical protein
MRRGLQLGSILALTAITAFAQSPSADACAPQYAFFGDNHGVQRPREIASPCLAPEVLKAADALGMARYIPPTVKSLITAEWVATGTLAPPGSTAPYNVSRVTIGISYVVPGIRVDFEGTGTDGKPVKGVYVAAGTLAWNEERPGLGATTAPGGAVDERLPLIWLTPHGAIWAAIDANPALVKVSQSGGKRVILAPFEGMDVRTTLGTDNRPERVEVQTNRGTYEARYSDYYDADAYRMFMPRRIEWTLNGRLLARLSLTRFRSNPYVVFPVPANVSQQPAQAQ